MDFWHAEPASRIINTARNTNLCLYVGLMLPSFTFLIRCHSRCSMMRELMKNAFDSWDMKLGLWICLLFGSRAIGLLERLQKAVKLPSTYLIISHNVLSYDIGLGSQILLLTAPHISCLQLRADFWVCIPLASSQVLKRGRSQKIWFCENFPCSGKHDNARSCSRTKALWE